MSEVLIGLALYLGVGFSWIYLCRWQGWISWDEKPPEARWIIAAIFWPFVAALIVYRIGKGEVS